MCYQFHFAVRFTLFFIAIRGLGLNRPKFSIKYILLRVLLSLSAKKAFFWPNSILFYKNDQNNISSSTFIIIFRTLYQLDYLQLMCVEWLLHGSSSNAPQVLIIVQMMNYKIYKCAFYLAFVDWPMYHANVNVHSYCTVGQISDCIQDMNMVWSQSNGYERKNISR